MANKIPDGVKLYVVQKKVLARNVRDAIKRAEAEPVHEVFIHTKWEDDNITRADAIGFIV